MQRRHGRRAAALAALTLAAGAGITAAGSLVPRAAAGDAAAQARDWASDPAVLAAADAAAEAAADRAVRDTGNEAKAAPLIAGAPTPALVPVGIPDATQAPPTSAASPGPGGTPAPAPGLEGGGQAAGAPPVDGGDASAPVIGDAAPSPLTTTPTPPAPSAPPVPQPTSPTTPQPTPPGTPDPGDPPASWRPPPAAAGAFTPSRLVIPALGVDGPVTDVGLDPTGAFAVPDDQGLVGRWNGGALPGEGTGTVALAGHVSVDGAPGLLFGLGLLVPGDVVWLTGPDGTGRTYTVDSTHLYAKAGLPVAEIFRSDVPERLALITCGGAYDPVTGHHDSNVVVYLQPTG